MQIIIVDITIPADEFIRHYQVSGAVVATHSRDGRSVRFPASILQRFVSHEGIAGSFEITFTDAGKFASVRRLD